MATQKSPPITLEQIEAALNEDGIKFTKEEGERGTKLAFTRPAGYIVNLADGGKETVKFDGGFELTFSVSGALRVLKTKGKVQ